VNKRKEKDGLLIVATVIQVVKLIVHNFISAVHGDGLLQQSSGQAEGFLRQRSNLAEGNLQRGGDRKKVSFFFV
jgi:hypothetical protein